MKIAVRSLILILLVLLMVLQAGAQTGAWIGQDVTGFGSGSRLYRAGGNCVAYTFTNAAKLYFFDINSSAWREFNFPSTQTFGDILAVGNIVFAYTDTFLLAFNGLTANTDTIRYQGTPLHLSGSPDHYCSYQCGENLAMFITDERLYLFDAAVDNWQEFDYNLPADFSGVGYYWVTTDYAGVLLYRLQQQVPTNLAYSTYLQAFAQTPRGMGYAGQDHMDHGFSGIYQWVPEIDHFVAGYSAYTNQFSHITIPADYDSDIGVIYSNRLADEETVWGMTARKTIEPFESVYYKVAFYDTRRAVWDSTTYNMNPQHEAGFGGWKLGGRFAWSTVNGDADIRTVFMYNGNTGQFSTMAPGLIMQYSSLLLLEGGNVCGINDTSRFWAYNFDSGLGTMMPYSDRIGIRHHTGGEDYLTYNQYWYSDTSTTYYYHGPSNTWNSLTITDTYGEGYAAGTHVFATMTTGAYAGVHFYSPTSNQIFSVPFTPNSIIGVTPKDYLAIASTTGRTVIFDTHHNNLHEFDCSTPNQGSSENVVIAANSSANTLSGYSSLNNSVTVINLGETPYVRGTGAFVGLGYIGSSGTRYYAFNSFYGNWVELIPQGSYVGTSIGDKTAIVVRSNYIYAFDPQAPNSIEEEEPRLPVYREISAIATYPNPFNSDTQIRFNLTEPCEIMLEIYDILGRKVDGSSLGLLTAGEHVWRWKADKKAAGIYLCRLSTKNDSREIKLTLLK